MQLTIILRKEIDEILEGEHLYNLVKERINDRNDVEVTAHISHTLKNEEPPE